MKPEKAMELLQVRRELEADIKASDLLRQDLKDKKPIRCAAQDYMEVLSGDPDLMARFVLAVEHRNSDHMTRLNAINRQIEEWK